MAYVIAFKIETIDKERRDALMEAVNDVLSEQLEGADTATITLTREGKTPRGKRKIVDTITIVAGEPIPDLSDFGLAEETPLERALRAAPARAIAP